MAPQFYPKFFYFPRKKTTTPTPNDSSTSMKIKTLIQAHIFPHVLNVIQAISVAKSKVMDLVKWKKEDLDVNATIRWKKMRIVMKKNKKRSKFRSSFRMCYNWHSSHVLPIPDLQGKMEEFDMTHMYYDSSWNSVICADQETSDELSGYLQWLEEKEKKTCEDPTVLQGHDDVDEIDHLAEMFIAKCHEKFRLEKQESYRRYQEMLARSM